MYRSQLFNRLCKTKKPYLTLCCLLTDITCKPALADGISYLTIPSSVSRFDVSMVVLFFVAAVILLQLGAQRSKERNILWTMALLLCFSSIVWGFLHVHWLNYSLVDISNSPTFNNEPVHSIASQFGHNILEGTLVAYFSKLNDNLQLFRFLSVFALTIIVETLVLFFGLSPEVKKQERLNAGIFLSTCTFPVVNVLLPLWCNPAEMPVLYYSGSEAFAIAAECALFLMLFSNSFVGRKMLVRNCSVIAIGNVLSLLVSLCVLRG